jgi:tetratricopeptide (TPR) repeat protein
LGLFGKLTGLMMAVVGVCQFILAIPVGLADQSTLPGATPVSLPANDLTLLQNKLGDLRVRLLTLQQQSSKQALKDPVSNRGRVEVYLLMEGMDAVPEKIQLAWDNQSVTTIEYSSARKAALALGGTDKLVELETNPGMHTLGVHYTRGMPVRDHSIYVTAPVQKKNTIMVLLLRPKVLKKGLELEHEMWDGPMTEKKEQWLQLWFQNAVFRYHMKQFEEAAGLLLTCLEFQRTPAKRAELLLWLGKTYLDWGLEGQAILTLQQVIQEFPKDRVVSEAWYYLVKAQYRQGQYDAVTTTYSRIKGQGFTSIVLSELDYMAGQSFLRLKDYPGAIAALTQVPKSSGHYPYALYALGQAYLGLGDTYAAQQAFKKLVDLNPPATSEESSRVTRLVEKGLVTLGLMFLEQNRHQEAVSVLGTVSTRSPFFDQALFGIGWGYMKLEEYVKAIAAFGDLTERFPDSPYAYEGRLMMGYSYSRLKAYTKAVDGYRKSLEASSRQVTLLTQKMETLGQKEIDLSQVNRSLEIESSAEANKLLETVERYQELALLSSRELPQSISNDLRAGLKDVGHRLSSFLKDVTLQGLQRQRERLEELSIHASIGIAKNLVLEKTEFGGEELVLE